MLGGLIAWIDAMSTVELASSIRKTGGPFIFARRAYGSMGGLAVGIADWLGNMGGIAFVSVVFAEYLHRLGIATGHAASGCIALLLVVWSASSSHSARKSAGGRRRSAAPIKAALFLMLIGGLLVAPRGDTGRHPGLTRDGDTALTISGIVVAMRAIFGTYQGWNSAAYFCEEVRDPGKAIARATFSGIAVVTGIYVLVNLALLHVMSPAEMAGSNLVAADAAERVFGAAADPIVTGISLIALVTIINAMVMVFPRVLYAMAREFEIGPLTRVTRAGTPITALIATVVVGGGLALIGVYETLLAFSTSILALMGVAVNAAVIVLRRKEPDLERPWRMPLYPLPAIVAFVINLALFVAFVREDPVTTLEAFAALAVLTLIGWWLTRGRYAGG
jgi:APA family basic amino acid/polyamine antiporter